MRAIVTGMIASYPVGGVAWDYAQYALGLEKLGFEVYYLEDTGWQTYNPLRGEYSEDCSYSVPFLRRTLESLSPTLGRRWHFRNMDGAVYGMNPEEFKDLVADADLFLNVSGGTLLRDDYLVCKRKVLIDSDPGWNHFRNYPNWDAKPNWLGSHGYRAHDHFFTYAECLGQPGCSLPNLGIDWKPTRPPAVLECWKPAPPGNTWTTVMTWKNFQEPIVHNGTTYGTKEMEFDKVESLPSLCPARLEIAVGGDQAPREHWRELGWSVIDSQSVSVTHEDYRDYIQRSRGEFSVAKNVYVATGSGWFSCRTACYLAAGRPAVVQETGFSRIIPTGEGLLSFADLAGAGRCLTQVEENYREHEEAALDLARSHFDSSLVLSDLLNRTNL